MERKLTEKIRVLFKPPFQRLLRKMEIITFSLIIIASGSFATETNTEISKVNIDAKDISVKEVLSEIEKQTDYLFIYNPNEINLNQKTSLLANNKEVKDVLNSVLNKTGIAYAIEGNSIMLMRRNEVLQSNTKRISGKVVDDNGEQIIGANVIEKGTTNGTTTDLDGNFVLNVSQNATLQISYIGYVTQEIRITNQTTLNITLRDDSQALEEVVVIGYGVVKKSDLTGSVSSVSDKQFKDQPVKRVEDILQGRTAGVEVTTLSGMPGQDIKVRIRGTTSINKSSDPLYVVDGIVSTEGLFGLNPSDIQSMEILKDASATAIYGSRGANGVVLVTTKRGEEGRTSIMFDANFGISNMMKEYDIMNAYEYVQALNDIRGSSTISEADLEAYKNGTKGIDWQDLMTQTGFSQDYKLSFSGGNKTSRYLLSGNVLEMDAITITTKFRRYSLRANIDSEVKPWLTISARLNAARTHLHNGDVSLLETANFSPAMEMRDPDSGVYLMDPYNSVAQNPYGHVKVNYRDDNRYYLNGNVTLLFKLMEGLTLSTQGGYNYMHRPYYMFKSALSGPGQINGMENRSRMYRYWQNTNILTYNKAFGDHNLTATAVWELSNNKYSDLRVEASNLANESVGYWNIANASTRTPTNEYSAESIVSGVGRIMYNYKGKYLVTGTFRADGSSKFQGDNRWGYFPSASVAWDVARENFMAEQNIFQQLKLRASYGITGNQAIDRYSTLGMLKAQSYGWGTANPYTGYWGDVFASPNLTWEKTYQYDIGLDASILDGKISFVFDWYTKQTKDLLFEKKVPMYNGGEKFWVNEGEIKNTGFDIGITAYPLSNNSEFTWETSFNAAYVKNEIIDLGGQDFITDATMSDYGGSMQIMKPGYPLGSFYVYKWAGFDDKGANLYEKANGDLTTNPAAEDLYVTGQGFPKWTFGFNNMFSWKNWTASIFFNGAAGVDRLNLTRFALASQTGRFRFISLRDSYYKGWDKVENKSKAEYPSHTNPDTKYYGNSDNWLENASFLKLKNISIAYTIPKHITQYFDIQVSVSAQNLFTITGYKGLDPEGYNSYSGIDQGVYPVPRTFSFGAKLTF